MPFQEGVHCVDGTADAAAVEVQVAVLRPAEHSLVIGFRSRVAEGGLREVVVADGDIMS